MVSKRLGGGDLTRDTEPKYAAWLFVANPEIFKWEQAFAEYGVDWTGSLGTYAQKLLRRQIHAGDRVLGYQAGPHYEICCELQVTSAPVALLHAGVRFAPSKGPSLLRQTVWSRTEASDRLRKDSGYHHRRRC